MNKCIFIAVTLALRASACARQDDLSREGGLSPDAKFTVLVEQANRRQATIQYVVQERRGGPVWGRFKSSYQPEDDTGNFAWDQSHPSWIYWRADSQYVAIDEANHQREGTVILARRLEHSFRQIPVSDKELMDYTKQPWDRARLFFGDNGFLPHDRAEIFIIGLVKRRGSDEYVELSCSVTLDLRQNGKIVKVTLPNDTKSPDPAMHQTAGSPRPVRLKADRRTAKISMTSPAATRALASRRLAGESGADLILVRRMKPTMLVSDSPLDPNRARRAIGAMFFFGFGGAWIELYALDAFGGPPFVLISIALIALILLLAAYRRYKRYQPALAAELPSARQARADRVFNVVNAAQWIIIFLLAIVLSHFGLTRWIIPAIIFIVGLHFLPLAYVFDNWPHYVTGAALMTLAFAYPRLAHGGPHNPVGCLGAGVILWLSAMWAITDHSTALQCADESTKEEC